MASTSFKAGEQVLVEAMVAEIVGDNIVIGFRDTVKRVWLTPSAVHLAPGDGERGNQALKLLRELVIGEEFAGDEYPKRFRKFVSEICDLARPLIADGALNGGAYERQ